MANRKVRNHFRDGIGDYYKTNRKIAEETKEKEKRKKLNSKEKSMILVIIGMLVILTVKSVLLDEVKNLSPEEEKFKDFVTYSVEEQYHGFLEDKGLMMYRVYDIYVVDPDEKTILRYVDPRTGQAMEINQDKRYNARVRGYFLWIFPAKHFSVTAKVLE